MSHRTSPSRLALSALLLVALLAPTVLAKPKDKNKGKNTPPPPPNLLGTYTLTFAGSLTGREVGTATVAADNTLSVTASPRDRAGNAVSFSVDSLTVADNRFSGPATLDGADAAIAGRVDLPNDQNLNTARFTATVTLPNGEHAKIVGKRAS